MAAELADRACDHRTPTLAVETITTTTRVLRMTGVLADSATGLMEWSCELPGLLEPVGWLMEPPPVSGADDDEDGAPPVHPHAAGPTREVVVQLRSNALAFVANESGAAARRLHRRHLDGAPADHRVRASHHRRPGRQRDPRAAPRRDRSGSARDRS